MILTDNETKVDLLNNEAIAKTIIELLREKPERAVTIGVHGDWGAGKSSILEMIENGLSSDEDVLCIKFNGWRFQGFEDAKIALIEGIVTGLIEKRPLLTQAGVAVKDIFRRIDWLKIARHGGGLAFTAFTGIPTADQIGAVVGTLKGIFSDPSKLATKENYDKAIDGVQGLLKPGESKNVPEEIEAFRKAFDDLLKQAGIKQLIVLIDDLDRCLPDTAIETLEAVRLFVFTARTAFIVAADEAMIEYSVRKHFPELPDTTGPRDYARNYLEKLIQIPFRIPALGETETRIYVTLLLIGAELGEDDPAYSALITVARELLKRPWKTAGLDAQTVKTALGDKAGQVQNALTLSDQIGPILASGTQGNPRQIKRFLNTLLLRHRTALARGFGDEVKLPVLAKLMLAERFLSRLFDQIASAAARDPDGRCVDLAALEAAASEEKPTPKARRAGPKISSTDAKPTVVPDSKDSAILTEWKAADAIRAWARLSPALAEVDLRPYLFVTKDRKDYFGAASVLGRLAAVVEKLLGPKLAVQAFEGELKQLVPAEAAQVRLGALSTRTTHPFYMARWNELLGALGVGGKVENPYWNKTKGEMVAECANPALLKQLAPLSLSCSSPTKGRWTKKPQGHCGYCLPCLIRRASLRGGDSTVYGVPDLKAATLDTRQAEGQQVRSFQIAIARLSKRPELAKALIHKPGPLYDDPTRHDDLADVYRRGLEEVGRLLTGVRAAPS